MRTYLVESGMLEPFEIEQFWEHLLLSIEARSVVPVVGAELLITRDGDRLIPLYRAVAQRLLSMYGRSGIVLRKHHELNDAVGALSAAGHYVNDLYALINKLLQELLLEDKEALQPLRELATIRHFDLFATTTPDDLLVRALNSVRFDGTKQTVEIEYAPKLPTNGRRDIPRVLTSNYTAVFYLFGKADVSAFYAIHDEDSLEFLYTLQAGNGPERMFSQLRTRNLLLIGCTFADCLSRFFLRLSNSDRLFSQRTKREFLAGQTTAQDRSFTLFLKRFSQDSRYYPVEAAAFVSELHRRWSERNPTPGRVPVPNLGDPETSSLSGELFISYCREDIGAAKRLFDDLQEIGGDVVWLDRFDLEVGDDWNQIIRGAIHRCSFFRPLISDNTEKNTEGYFRFEWNEAVARFGRIQGRKFIMPIVIDTDYSGGIDRYSLVPEQFKTLQYGFAPRGAMTDELRAAIKDLLRLQRRMRAS